MGRVVATAERLEKRPSEKGRGMTVAQIIAQVAREAGLTPADILGRSRLKPVVEARQEAMCRAREMTGQSLPQIGCSFGRDHKTVLHGCRVAERRRKQAAVAALGRPAVPGVYSAQQGDVA